MLPPRKLAIVRRMGEVATRMEHLQAEFERLEHELEAGDKTSPRRRRKRRKPAPRDVKKKVTKNTDVRSPRSPSVAARLVEILESQAREMTSAELAGRLHIDPKQVGVALSKLNTAGRVHRVARGVYRAKEMPREPADDEDSSKRPLETRVLDLFQSGGRSWRAVDVMARLGEGGGVAAALQVLVESGRLIRGTKGHHELAPANEAPVVQDPPPRPKRETVVRKPRRESRSLKEPKYPSSTIHASVYLTNARTKALPWEKQLELFRHLPILRAASWGTLLESQRFAPIILEHLVAQASVELPHEFTAELDFVSSRPVLRAKISEWCASVDPFGDVLCALIEELRLAACGDVAVFLSSDAKITASHRSWLDRCGAAMGALNAVRGRLAVSNIGLGMRMIGSHVGRGGMSFPDLVNESFFGLLRAVDRFEPERGLKFSTYATWWIRQSARRAIQNNGRLIRIPVHLQDLYRDVRAARSHVGEDSAAVAEHLKIPVTKVEKFEKVERTMFPVPRALDQPLRGYRDGDDGATLGDLLVSDELDPAQRILDQEASDEVLRHVARLPSFDAEVIRRRFGIGCKPQTLSEIGSDHNLSRERIRQIEARALGTLRQILSDPEENPRSGHTDAPLQVDKALCRRVLSVLKGHPRRLMSGSQVGRLLGVEPWVVRRACVELLRKNLVQQVGKRFVFLPSAEEEGKRPDENGIQVQLVDEVDRCVLSHLKASPSQVLSRKKIGEKLDLNPWTVRDALGRLARLGLIQQVGTRFRALGSYERVEDTDAFRSSPG